MNSGAYQTLSFKDQIYQEKLRQLEAQLLSLKNGTHAEFLRGKAAIEQETENRLFCNEISYAFQKECIERDYETNLTAARKEFQEKKAEMKEALLNELEERKRQIEHEYINMDLNGDGCEVKQPPKRNLRRRFNENSGAPGNGDKKSRKSSPIVNVHLSEADIDEDLKRLSTPLFCGLAGAGSASCSDSFGQTFSGGTLADQSPATLFGGILSAGELPTLSTSNTNNNNNNPSPELNVFSNAVATVIQNVRETGKQNSPGTEMLAADVGATKTQSPAAQQVKGQTVSRPMPKQLVYQNKGRLYYHKKLYLKGQTVILSSSETGVVTATIQSIGSKEIALRSLSEKAGSITTTAASTSAGKRITVTVQQLQQGKFTLKHKS